MKIYTMLSAPLLLLAIGANGPPVERVVGGEAMTTAVINGREVHLRIEPSSPGLLLVAPRLAPVLDLKVGGGLFGIMAGFRIGPQRVYGHTKVVRFAWPGENTGKRRVGWMTSSYQPPADGTIGPGGLPESIVRFALRPARAKEATLTLPMEGGTGVAGSWHVLEAATELAGRKILLRFDPYHRTTLATASAAVAIADTHSGSLTSETGHQEIAFGIERPYRVMRLARPLTLGGLSLVRLGVRVTDGDITGRISEDGVAPEQADPDEIIVTGKKKLRPGLLILGSDALANCSSIVYDKPARRIHLTCSDI